MESGLSVESVELSESKGASSAELVEDQRTRSSVLLKLQSWFSPLLLSHHPPAPPSPSLAQRLKYSLLCPPHGRCGDLTTLLVILTTLWAGSYALLGPLSLPTSDLITVNIQGGAVFTTLLLLVSAVLGGKVVECVRLPPLLGMLLVGMFLSNAPGVKEVGRLDSSWSSAIRSTALVVILIRAGLGLDPDKLRRLSGMVFRLAFLPCLAESCTVALASHFILGLPWLWAFMLGFVLAAVSPAVVVPCLLSLQQRGLGVNKGVPTLVIAAASVDDVLAISCFTILLGVIFNPSGDLTRTVLQGPLEVLVGVLYGLLWGVMTIFLPPSPSPGRRLIMLLGGGLLAVFGLPRLELPGAGPLAVLVMAFVVGLGWRRQGWADTNPVTEVLADLWTILQPLLFSLIGAEVDLAKLDLEVLGLAVVVLVIGLIVRLIISQLSVLGGDLNLQERIFVSLAWLPKATVQAAIGPKALDTAKELLLTSYPGQECPGAGQENLTLSTGEGLSLAETCEMIDHGNIILTVAVSVIIITAPIGAVAILLSGPRLLSREDPPKEREEHEA